MIYLFSIWSQQTYSHHVGCQDNNNSKWLAHLCFLSFPFHQHFTALFLMWPTGRAMWYSQHLRVVNLMFLFHNLCKKSSDEMLLSHRQCPHSATGSSPAHTPVQNGDPRSLLIVHLLFKASSYSFKTDIKITETIIDVRFGFFFSLAPLLTCMVSKL